MQRTILTIPLCFGIFLSLAGCGQSPSKPNMTRKNDGFDANFPPGGNPFNSANFPKAASLASFKANLYEPLLKPYCESCHALTFVESDISKAHEAFLGRSDLTKFAGLEQTAPVKKMTEAHNCWEAEVSACVAFMTEKMNLWLKDLEANGFKPIPVVYPNATSEVALTSVTPTPVTIPQEYAGSGVDKATLAAPFIAGTDDIDGPIKSYASSPMATARINAAVPAQAITFNLDAKVAGTYFVWARVKTLADANNEFFIQANAANPLAFNPPVTGKDTWKWAQLMNANNTAFSFAVATPGQQTLRVLFREGGAKINYLVITTKQDFNGEIFSNDFLDVVVPLNVPGAPGAKIIANVWEKTAEEGKRSLGVRYLRIESPVPLRIKKIYPLINGIYNTNQGTYTIVDTVAGGPDPEKSIIATGGSTSSTWLADLKVDKLSFAFEVLEVAK